MLKLLIVALVSLITLPNAYAEKRISVEGPFHTVTLVENNKREIYFIQSNGELTKPFPKRRLSYYRGFFRTDAAYHSVTSGLSIFGIPVALKAMNKFHDSLVRVGAYEATPILSSLLVSSFTIIPAGLIAISYFHAASYTIPTMKAANLNNILLKSLDKMKDGEHTYLNTSLNFRITNEGRFKVIYGVSHPENTKDSKKFI